MERITGIEPALSAWEAEVLPLNYIRILPRKYTASAALSFNLLLREYPSAEKEF